MAPSSKSRKPSSSKKPSKYDSDSDDERPSASRKPSSSGSKKLEKTEPKTSLLKSMFTKDRSEVAGLSSKNFKDETRFAGKSSKLDSAMFKDESRAPKARNEVKSEKYKSEKKKEVKKEKKIVEEDEDYTEEPDFSDFQSKYVVPEKEVKEVEKVERKPENKPEKNYEKSKKPEPSAKPKKYESVKYESKIAKSPAFKSNPNFVTAYTDARDIEMAEKQTMIAELTGEELREQEEWVAEKLKTFAGTCPAGFNWTRYTEEACGEQVHLDGYRCTGRSHFVTHEMIAKGEEGTMQQTRDFSWWEGCSSRGYPMEPFTGVRWLTQSERDQFTNVRRGNPSPSQMVGNVPPQSFGASPSRGGGFGNFQFRNPNQYQPPPGSLQDRLKHHKGGQQPGDNGGFGGFGGQQPPPGGFSGFFGYGQGRSGT
ncbi:hypothetical protein IFR05_010393 [Cadophora sp. M221]|nr:hypothetical protein IFR05_010393 [Cadophora sp. M221]